MEREMAHAYTDDLYSETQLKILFAVPILPSLLSVIGSSLILRIIFSDHKRKLKHVYHRLLVGFSMIDIFFSMVYATSSLPIPKGTPGTFGAMGNWTTCELTGFLTQFNISKGPYWAFICLYYTLIVKYSVPEEKIVKYEMMLHAFALLSPIGLGITMIKLNMYNPMYINPGRCFLNRYPANCSRDGNVECERGENYFVWSAINIGIMIISLLVGVLSLLLTCRSVQKTQIRQSRWNLSSHSDILSHGVNNLDVRSTLDPERGLTRGLSQARLWSSSLRLSRLNKNTHQQSILAETTRQVCIQTMLYLTSYILALTPYVAMQFLALTFSGSAENNSYFFFWSFVSKITIPSTGIWNFLIYCRPRLLSLRKQYPDSSTLKLLQHLIHHSGQESTQNTGRPVQRPGGYTSPTLRHNENQDREFTPELDIQYLQHECQELEDESARQTATADLTED